MNFSYSRHTIIPGTPEHGTPEQGTPVEQQNTVGTTKYWQSNRNATEEWNM